MESLQFAQAVLLDVSARQFLHIARDQLPGSYKNQLESYRYGPGVFKIDYALDGLIPWKAEECKRAATVYVGGSLEDISISERAVWKGKHPEKPYILIAQQSIFDPLCAPDGKHTIRLNPYSTPLKGVYLCSSTNPPGGGVHSMCGYSAAMSVLKAV